MLSLKKQTQKQMEKNIFLSFVLFPISKSYYKLTLCLEHTLAVGDVIIWETIILNFKRLLDIKPVVKQ